MEPARLLGTCKPGSRAGMDSRTGVEGIINDLGNEVEEEKKNLCAIQTFLDVSLSNVEREDKKMYR